MEITLWDFGDAQVAVAAGPSTYCPVGLHSWTTYYTQNKKCMLIEVAK